MKRYMTEAQIDKAARQGAGRIAMELWLRYNLKTDDGRYVSASNRELLRRLRERIGECVRSNARPEKR